MLAQTMFLVAVIALFATSAAAGIAGYARTQAASAAKALIVPGVEAALASYQRTLGATIAAQIGAADPALLPASVPALNGGTPWSEAQLFLSPAAAPALRISVDIRPTAQTVPACASPGSGPDVELDGQCSAFVQESRLSLTVTTDVGPADAQNVVSPLAHSRVTVTLRLFAQPPYSMVAGIKDSADPAGFHEGDAGGFGNALGTFAPPGPGPDDTTIHVLFQCVAGTGDCAFSAPAPQDDPRSLPWTNGNGAA